MKLSKFRLLHLFFIFLFNLLFLSYFFYRAKKVIVSEEDVKKSMGFFFTMQLAKKCGQIWKKKSSLGDNKNKFMAKNETK